MPLITLLSDWANQDYYLSIVKGKLYSALGNITIVDIAHGIPSHHYLIASFILKASWSHFPKGTVHMIMVDTVPEANKTLVAVKYASHWFLANNNGCLSFLNAEDIEDIISINSDKNSSQSFPEADLMVPAAIEIINTGSVISRSSEPVKLMRRPQLMPLESPGKLEGHVIFISSFGNVITNISISTFQEFVNNRNYIIYIGSNHFKIECISARHTEQPIGEFFAIFNSLGFLEVGINKGNAAEMFLLKIASVIRIVLV